MNLIQATEPKKMKEVIEWVERHGLDRLSRSDLVCAFDDAATREASSGAVRRPGFKVTYFVEVAGGNGVNGKNLRAEGFLPFAPHRGLMVIVLPDDDYREIEGVYWSGTAFEVFLAFAEFPGWRSMMKLGWVEADGTRPKKGARR